MDGSYSYIWSSNSSTTASLIYSQLTEQFLRNDQAKRKEECLVYHHTQCTRRKTFSNICTYTWQHTCIVFPAASKVWEKLCQPTTKGATLMHYRMDSCWLSLPMLTDLALWLRWGSPQMTAPNSASILHSSPQGCFAHHGTWGISAGSTTKQNL